MLSCYLQTYGCGDGSLWIRKNCEKNNLLNYISNKVIVERFGQNRISIIAAETCFSGLRVWLNPSVSELLNFLPI